MQATVPDLAPRFRRLLAKFARNFFRRGPARGLRLDTSTAADAGDAYTTRHEDQSSHEVSPRR
jgi:hypothetical protein